MYDVDIARLTAALTPSKEKLCSKGIASVRSRVANLKDYLPHLADIHALQQALERHLSNEYADAEYLLDDVQQHAIAMLGQSKFASAEWIYNRRRPATLQYSARLACGIVEVHLEISGTHLSSCRFYGDFLGNLSAADIEQMLVGCEYSPSGIAQCLAQCNIAQYFDGVTLNDLIQLLYPNT
jgi:lipoate-protein ligase A